MEAVLAEFRTWIERAAAAGTLLDTDEQPSEAPLDLYTLLSQFTALRHEVNLQTRAVRAQQEQNTETLEQYRAALEALQATQAAAGETLERDTDELLRPLLKNLVDACDALALARREVERVRQALEPLLEEVQAEPVPPVPELPDTSSSAPTPGFWAKLFGGSHSGDGDRHWEQAARQYRQMLEAQQERLRRSAEAAQRVAQFFESVLTGYTMSLQRLERILQQCDLEPIASVGEPFDPELMEVVELATDTERPANEVVEELRRGYLWRGRVFRYAQVRVAKP